MTIPAYPFLTAVDPNEAIKGSRDPLGVQPIWTQLGRELVGNLTTQTNSIRGFTTVMLCYHFARRYLDEQKQDKPAPEAFLDAFLCVEQLVAYSRIACHPQGEELDEGIRGTNVVRRRLRETPSKLPVTAESAGQILSNQKAYGLWGLFSVSADHSGLVDRDGLRLTPAAMDQVDAVILPRLGRSADAVLPFLSGKGWFDPYHKHAALAQALTACCQPTYTAQEVDFYRRHLVFGADSHRDNRQERFWSYMVDGSDDAVSMTAVRSWRTNAQEAGDATVASALDRILRMEVILAPVGRLFGFLQTRHGETLEAVAAELQKEWRAGFTHIRADQLDDLRPVLTATGGAQGFARIQQLALALQQGAYAVAIRQVLDHNAYVMKQRGGQPWIALEDTLNVRFRSETEELPTRDELPELWANPYFLQTLKTIGTVLHARRAA
jgi:hypothetical protein